MSNNDSKYRPSSNGADEFNISQGVLGYCVTGPGEGLGYHSWYLNPSMQLPDYDTAERAAKIAQSAYDAGYKQAQRDIRKSLGL
jgi:hypothetical protein